MSGHKRIKTNIPKLYRAPKQLYRDTVHIFTDGSCFPNPGDGGWAAVLLFNDMRKEVHGGGYPCTNNEMELRAILEGLKMLKTRKHPVIVYSDSQYCINAVSVWHRGWAARGWYTASGTPVKNVELIKEVVALAGDSVVFKWVKGHIGIPENERADELAGNARKQAAMVRLI